MDGGLIETGTPLLKFIFDSGSATLANYCQSGTLTRLRMICIHSNLALIRYGRPSIAGVLYAPFDRHHQHQTD